MQSLAAILVVGMSSSFVAGVCAGYRAGIGACKRDMLAGTPPLVVYSTPCMDTARDTTSDGSATAPARIPLAQLAAYGAGGIIPIALFNIAGILVGLMGNISLGLSAFWLGVILIIPRLWDAIADPLVGHFSDNLRTRWGRRRPFLLVGGIAVAVTFVVMWWVPKHAGATEEARQWMQLGYILFWLLLFYSANALFEIPHGALGMEM